MQRKERTKYIVLPVTTLLILSMLLAPTARADSIATTINDLTSDVATQVGTVNVSTLPLASTSSSPAAALPIFLIPPPDQQIDLSAGQTPTITPTGTETFVHIQKAVAGTPGTNPNPCICTPPDMGLGASSKFIVQMVNLAGTIYKSEGSIAKATFSLSDFWFLPVRGGPLVFGMSDPQVLFDAATGRWFASIIDLFDVNRVRFAVSATGDPTGVWFIYAVRTPTSTTLPDQPFIGYSDDKFIITANDFTFDPTFTAASYTGAQFWVLNKSEMLSGSRFVDLVTTPQITQGNRSAQPRV